MDHLPVPANPAVRLEIPYLCTEIYDGGPFAAYPQRHGWELIEASNRLNFKRYGNSVSREETAAFLQTWLYFGLLSETLGWFSPDIHAKFIAEGSQRQKILTSRHLEEMVVDWGGRMTGATTGLSWIAKWLVAFPMYPSPENDRQAAKTRFHACWKIIHRVVNFTHQHIRHPDEGIEPDVLDHHQLMALSALIQYLCLVWQQIDCLNAKGHHSNALSFVGFTSKDSCVLLRKHMQDSNWCPSDICRIMGTMSPEAIWYYANMQPPRKEFDHSKCSEHFCSHTQIDSKGAYTLAHSEPDCSCSCQLIHADRKTLQDILQKGDIPVLELVDSKSGLRVVSNTQRPYIAISHIWAEGLGDPHDNALHSCEVKRLFRLLEQLPILGGGRPALWIDTICVPLGDFKNLAIERMKETYQYAAGVLVLDAYIQSFKAVDCDPLEVLARINNSSWMQRLWTLQEGRLAKRIWFQFADGPLDISNVFHALFQSRHPFRAASAAIAQITTSYRASRVSFLDQLEEIRKPLHIGIFAVREAVMCRAVSQSSDEALCLAFLMDLDVRLIVSALEEKKMEAFWKQISRIPISLVFSKAPKKLDTPGFHWAPRSFCGPIPDDIHNAWGGSPLHLRNVYAIGPTEKGLLVELPGIMFRPVNSPKGWSVAFKNTDLYTFCTPDNQWFNIRLSTSWGSSTMKERPEHFSQNIAIILPQPLNPTQPGNNKSVEDISSSAIGGQAVVSKLVDIRNDTFYVNGLQHAFIVQVSNAFSLMFTAAVQAAESLWETDDPATERTDMLQYGDGHTDTISELWKAAVKTLETQRGGECSHNIVLKCYKLAEAAISDGELLSACLQTGLWADIPETERQKHITYLLAMKVHDVFIEGYNKVEAVGPLQRWYVD